MKRGVKLSIIKWRPSESSPQSIPKSFFMHFGRKAVRVPTEVPLHNTFLHVSPLPPRFIRCNKHTFSQKKIRVLIQAGKIALVSDGRHQKPRPTWLSFEFASFLCGSWKVTCILVFFLLQMCMSKMRSCVAEDSGNHGRRLSSNDCPFHHL
jgi:hypothetical protein